MKGKIMLEDKLSKSKITIETDNNIIYKSFIYDFNKSREARIPFESMGISIERPYEFTLFDSSWSDENITKDNELPQVHDVFTGRLLNFILDYFDSNKLDHVLSNCPNIDSLKNKRGIGVKSLSDYERIIKNYNS